MQIARILTATGLIGAGLLAGLVLSMQVEVGGARASKTQAVADEHSSSTMLMESPFVAVADRVVPGTVAISTQTERGGGGGGRGFQPFGDMFDDPFPDNPREERQENNRRRPGGSGTGFFLDRDGYVMTNNHVIANAEKVTVTTSTGQRIEARIIGQDPETDVALLKIDPDDHDGPIPALELGDSENIRVGDWAIAVGNPFGQLAGSVTVGVISAKGRQDLSIMGGTPAYQNFIQTDASINFGNSGGPLVNAKSQVIGVNTAINPSGQGIGFAIPINMAARIADQLKTDGRVVRGYLGIYPQELTPEVAESLDIPGTEGILIGNVLEDTPADAAGLERGDVIVRLNGRKLDDDVNGFRLMVAEQAVGESIQLDVIRDGREREIEVILAERPDAITAVAPGRDEEEGETWAGLRVEDMDSRESRRLSDFDDEGVVVTRVDPDSPADEAGIVRGDIVKEIGNVEISDLGDYRRAVKKYEDKRAVAVLLKRGDQTLYVGVKP